MQVHLEKENYSYIIHQGPDPDLMKFVRPGFLNYVESIYDLIDLSGFYVCIINVSQIFNINQMGYVREISDCYEYLSHCQQIAALKNKTFLVVLDNVYEAPCYDDNYKEIIDNLVEHLCITYKQVSILGFAFDYESKVKHITSHLVCCDRNLNNYDYKTIPQHHFISLARRPRPCRIFSTIMLLDRGLEKYGYISLGSMEEDTGFHRVAKKTLPDRYADRFPFLIDGFINDYDGQYGKDFKITHAFFNFVNESSADKNADNGFWTRACMTEKTTKAFAAGQIPIILGPYGNLHCIRSIGFDLFDDIIDNSYDSITNQYLRTIKAVEQLEKVCDKPIQYWQEWKQQNMERFEKNNFILKNLMKNHRHETQLLIQDYLKDIKI